MSNNSVKPLELVVSAIHSLRETRGSTPLNILSYLSGKYNVETEMLRPYVKTGLKKGVSFGLITQDSGLYRLNEALSAPMDQSTSNQEKILRCKSSKAVGILKKGKYRQSAVRKRRGSLRPQTSQFQRSKRRMKKSRDRRKRIELSSRPHNNERRTKQRRQNARGKKRMRKKSERSKKPKRGDRERSYAGKPVQKNCEEDDEASKDTPKM